MSMTMAGSAFSQDTTEVLMQNFKFNPDTISIQKGDVVKWVQDVEGTPHNTVSGSTSGNCSPDGLWESPLYSEIGQSFSYKFDTAGAFSYYCTPHCNLDMYGLVTVEDTTTQNPPTADKDTTEVLMQNFKFNPDTITVEKGDVVTWIQDVNNAEHNTVSGTISAGGNCSPDGLWESPLYENKGKSFSYEFDSTGQFSYFCTTHCGQEMYGLVTVVDSITDDPSTGIANKTEGVELKAYPNPVQNNVKVETNLTDASRVQLSVVNMQGRILQQASYQDVSGQQTLNLDMGGVSAGSYYLRLQTAGGQVARQLLIKQ
jgi:plastocyanin